MFLICRRIPVDEGPLEDSELRVLLREVVGVVPIDLAVDVRLGVL